MIESRWDPTLAAGLDEVDRLVYRSNLLGSDPRITNFGGGNTSAKVAMKDPLTGDEVEVLWVKGSGGDLGSMKRAGLASLYLDKVLGLERNYSSGTHEDDIVALYNHATYNLNPTACSIDTPLHAFVPKRHVDHMHADAIIAIAASEDAEELTRKVFGDEVGYLPWKRPGFELGLQLRDKIRENPSLKGIVLGSHGFINWADTAQECYELTLDLINRAIAYFEANGSATPFGEVKPVAAPTTWTELLPRLRGKVNFNGFGLIAHIDDAPEVLEFLGSAKMDDLARLGTSCPDHFLRTKIRPLVLRDPAQLDEALASFRADYQAYHERCKRPDSPAMRNPNPSVVLVPGLGMVSFGKNKQEARVTGEFYRRAIEVMRGAESVSRYVALPEQEAFDIEYWLLEEAKLKRMPAEKEFSRKIAIVTGGAQGIGLATARRLAREGACVAILDINAEKLAQGETELKKDGVGIGIQCDVTDAASLAAAFDRVITEFGGLDVCVVNAGNARRGTIADTTDEDYEFLSDLLMKAYFTTMQRATQIMIEQGTGGSIVVIGSKNGVAVGSNAAIYSAAKSFELHLMRSAANDLAKHGIRCNAVNPDAVLQGSGIWSDAWKEQTAASLGISIDELPEYYRKRSMLARAVEPDHIAEAVAWLASETRSSRTTGATIPVDGGVREAFLR